MGFLDAIKNAMGGKEKDTDTVQGPSSVLREAGIDPSELDFSIGGDGTVTITGRVEDADTRNRISELVGGIPQVSSVDNRIEVGPPPAEAPQTGTEAPTETSAVAPEAASEETGESRPKAPVAAAPEPPVASAAGMASEHTHTVEPGDSLWKIAAAHYGDGTRYKDIFEANRDILDNPDLIKPGQVLKLPEL